MQHYDFQPKKMPAQARSRATFQAILDATIQILIEQGYAALNTNRVAEMAGVSIGSLYEYFPHKKALVATALGREIDALTQDLLTELRRALKISSDPRKQTESLIHALAAALDQRREIVRTGIHEVPFFWEIPKARNHMRRLMRIARKAQLQGRVPSSQQGLDERAWVLVTMVWNVLVQNAIHRPSYLDGERIVDSVADIVATLL